ncbi:hypothetical protein BKA64DRAFT_663025 [Cadophora sp. MPI-SDFR-AT-0126]|nr:hypothetical protein BKA64DRAFT_663025 [Leotiomycetes sp. MPI-SDFR-AT-0126]
MLYISTFQMTSILTFLYRHDLVPAPALHARQAGVVSLLGNGSYIGSSTTTICAPGGVVPTALPYTTVYTTEYIQVCPTETPCPKGTKTQTFTITETCSGGKAEYTPPVIPPNFTTVVQVCNACAGKPTLTVTCPTSQVTPPPVCTGPGCPVYPPPVAPSCPGPNCPPTPPPGTKCPGGPNCPPTPPPGAQCPGPNCPPTPPPGTQCPGPNCPTPPGSKCPGPNCPPTSNTTTPPYIISNSGSNGQVHIAAILLGASIGLAAFCL